MKLKNRLMMVLRNKLLLLLVVNLIFFFVVLYFMLNDSFRNINLVLSDHLYYERPPPDYIIIVGIDDKSLEKIGRWPWKRAIFAEFLKKSKNASVVGMDIGFFEKAEGDDILAQYLDKRVVLSSQILDGKLYKPIFDTDHGYANIVMDSDGVVRRIFTNLSEEKPFSQVIVEKYLNREINVPSEIIINFGGPPGRVRTISFYDFINSDYDVSGKIVLLGVVAPSLHDNYFTPFSNGKQMAGVEIHANIVETILMKSYIVYSSLSHNLVIILIFYVLISFLFFHYGVKRALVFSLALVFLYLTGVVIIARSGYFLNIVYPVFSIVLFSLGSVTANYLYENKKKREILDVFGKYVSKEVVDKMFNKGEYFDLEGEIKYITILFSDIRGFTTFAESRDPHTVVKILNSYLSALTERVLEHEGVLNKYIGDSLMCLFNTPNKIEDHEIRACIVALKMMKKVKELNKVMGLNLKIGIGINSGEAVVGNIGSERRKEYTAIGDSVNTASRLEGLTKYYGVDIIVGESVYKKARNKFIFRELDYVKVKGKKKPLRIYELREEPYDKRWDRALALYRKGLFLKAKEIFDKINDNPSKLFSKRCEFLHKQKIRKWEGIFAFDVK